MRVTLLRLILFLATGPALVSASMNGTASEIPLDQLLANRFGKLSLAEKRLANAAENGQTADCTDLSGDDKSISGEVITWLCTNPDASARIAFQGISMRAATITNIVDLQWAKVSFPIRAEGCVFASVIVLNHGHFRFFGILRSSVYELMANSAHFDEGVFLRSVTSGNQVDLGLAKIDGDLDCGDAHFTAAEAIPALDVASSEVKGNVLLHGDFKAEGGVTLAESKIGGDLDCGDGQFIGKKKVPGLQARFAQIKGTVSLTGRFKAEGGVFFEAAKVEGNFLCDDGHFVGDEETPAINGAGLEVNGYLFLRNGFQAEGKVLFYNGYVGRALQWSGAKTPDKTEADLRFIRVGTLLNRQDSWPSKGNLLVDGLVYEQIDDSAPPDAKVQLGWLALQPHDRFRSQPFEQLASVLRKMGLDEDARKVLIAKNEEHARYVQGQPEWLWYGLFGQLIGYGYSPWRAFFFSLVVIVIGWAAFRRGYMRGLITPTGETKYTMVNHEAQPISNDYPKFNAFVYSLETFVPLVKLGVADRWEPNGNRAGYFVERSWLMTGGCLRGYLWFHMIAGWVLSALWVGGITGLVKT